MTINNKPFKICTTCSIHHVENCSTCFGFGLYMSKLENRICIISAGGALDKEHDTDFIKCPECGGTPFGFKDIGEQLELFDK